MEEIYNPDADYGLIVFDNEEYSQQRTLNCVNGAQLREKTGVRHLAYSNKYGLMFAADGNDVKFKTYQSVIDCVEIMNPDQNVDDAAADVSHTLFTGFDNPIKFLKIVGKEDDLIICDG